MGALGTIVQVCTITALKYSTPLFVAPFEYTRLIFATVIGFVVFREIPDIYTVVGSIVILFSAYMLTRLGYKLDCKCKMEC
jgi:drug/metabolite transporter (DMT)-like permease